MMINSKEKNKTKSPVFIFNIYSVNLFSQRVLALFG